MDNRMEQHFVQTFLRKNRRERLAHELSTPEKRCAGLSRFCHQARTLLDPSKIVLEGEDLERRPAFARFVGQHDEICFLLSPDASMDGRCLPLHDALRQALACPDAVLILGSSFAVVYGEVMKGGRGKFLLSEK